MTIDKSLVEARGKLNNTESSTPYLDALLLLGHLTGFTKEQLLTRGNQELSEETLLRFRELLELREAGDPVAYLIGQKEFYGRDFAVGPGVLCPRPDTEILIEEALQLIDNHKFSSLLDLCSGTGCIALTLKLERPHLAVSASDISQQAAEYFSRNNKTLARDEITFYLSDLFEAIPPRKFDCIVSNPPYLTGAEAVNCLWEISREPALALDGGEDGLDLVRKISCRAPEYLNRPGALVFEAASPQMEAIKEIMKQEGFSDLKVINDLAGQGRVVRGVIF